MLKFTTAKFTTAMALAVVTGTTSIALAQTYPGDINNGQRVYRHDYGDHGRVPGPAYGHPGEPLGPVYMGTVGNEATTNPATCGPGACQDNPRY